MAGRFKIILSDLHLGAGFAEEGNALEDFHADQEFDALLQRISAESSRKKADVELIINGDAFEMHQVPHVARFEPEAVYPPESYYSSAEPDSALKMALIVAGHRRFFEALRRFLQPGPPRRTATFVKGNHDIDLHWRAVQDCIRQAAGATGERAPLLAFAEVCVSREGICVEHGNQYAELLSRVDCMEEPHDPDRPGQLLQAPGARLLIDLLNEVERERSWVDGVKPVHALVCYALLFDFPFAARALAALLRALPGVVARGTLVARQPVADLVRQLEDGERQRKIAARYQADQEYRAWFASVLLRHLPLLPPSELDEAMERATLGDAEALGDWMWQEGGRALRRAAERRAAEESARLVVFGHSHVPCDEDLDGGVRYLNSGTWTWRADLAGAGADAWRSLFQSPEHFTPQAELTYVRIDYAEGGEPRGQLLRWRSPNRARRPGSWWDHLRANLCQWLRRLRGRAQT